MTYTELFNISKDYNIGIQFSYNVLLDAHVIAIKRNNRQVIKSFTKDTLIESEDVDSIVKETLNVMIRKLNGFD